MKIFAHRVNDWKPGNYTGAHGAEIDVQFLNDGRIVAKHDPYHGLPPGNIANILEYSGYDKFFVDIKQQLEVKHLEKIAYIFGDKLHGIFDVPFPLQYYASRTNLPIYQRLSEWEPASNLTGRYWLDPLMACSSWKYQKLLSTVKKGEKVMLCSPELHGQSCNIVDVWMWVEERLKDGDERIEGIVTKLPDRALEIFKEYV